MTNSQRTILGMCLLCTWEGGGGGECLLDSGFCEMTDNIHRNKVPKLLPATTGSPRALFYVHVIIPVFSFS